MSNKYSVLIKVLFGVLFIVSITASYYKHVIQSEYEVLMNDDGLPTIDEE